MENFKEWLKNKEFIELLHEAIKANDQELIDHLLNEANLSKWVNIPLAMATALIPFGNFDHHDKPPETTMNARDLYDHPTLIAQAITKEFKVKVNPDDINMIKPSDIIKPMYGDKYQQVFDLAKQKQNDDIFNTPAVTDTNKFDIAVPVIYADPILFGQAADVKGFCTDVMVDNKLQPFCVVKSKEFLAFTRHEISHAAQKRHMNKSLGGTGDFGNYFMNETELGVRLAEFKRNYYQMTGEIVTSDQQSLSKAIKHFLSNTSKYSLDVQQLKDVIIKAKKDGLLPKLMNFIQNNIDKVVNTNMKTNKIDAKV